jgi:hypothetical protein
LRYAVTGLTAPNIRALTAPALRRIFLDAILGGFLEAVSFISGMRFLLLLAAGLYVISAVTLPRNDRTVR